MHTSRISALSSNYVNEFNREDEAPIIVAPPNILQKSTSWFIFLCSLLFLLGVLIPSIIVIAVASNIDNILLQENDIMSSNEECQNELKKVEMTANFVLFNFISFKVLSSLNLLLSSVGLMLAIGYIFFYYRLRILKRNVFASPAIPPYLVILNAFVILFCILQSFIYWINESNIDVEVLRNGTAKDTSTCYEAFVTSDGFAELKSTLETDLTTLYGAAVFLFSWTVTFLILWIICYVIRRFKLKEDIFRRPI